MASTKDYLNFVLENLSGLDGITHRAMMGEYIIYYQGKVIGGIYDNRFLVKPTKSAKEIIPDAPLELPYEGAKMMLLADFENRELMNELIPAIADDLPAKK
ncbi:MAG: TfoX/Sxy family protein [Eubacterium sp.]|nr:TfoX/Sxy family protein [Eubacterium sp.]